MEPEEQALLEAVQETARGTLAAYAASLTVTWRRVGEKPAWPEFVLRPSREDALAIGVSVISGQDWIDTTLYLDDDGVTFELWAESGEERLRRTRERIAAVIEGGVEVMLRGREYRPLFGRRRRVIWSLVAVFDTASGPDETSRSPEDPSVWRDFFAGWPQDEASQLIGPRLFTPYLESA